jgi:hypothetical protein
VLGFLMALTDLYEILYKSCSGWNAETPSQELIPEVNYPWQIMLDNVRAFITSTNNLIQNSMQMMEKNCETRLT